MEERDSSFPDLAAGVAEVATALPGSAAAPTVQVLAGCTAIVPSMMPSRHTLFSQ
jgi:hypothetical protein